MAIHLGRRSVSAFVEVSIAFSEQRGGRTISCPSETGCPGAYVQHGIPACKHYCVLRKPLLPFTGPSQSGKSQRCINDSGAGVRTPANLILLRNVRGSTSLTRALDRATGPNSQLKTIGGERLKAILTNQGGTPGWLAGFLPGYDWARTPESDERRLRICQSSRVTYWESGRQRCGAARGSAWRPIPRLD